MSSLAIKIFACPLTVYLASLILPGHLRFTSAYQWIIVGLVLAATGYLMEVMLLREGTATTSTYMDFAASVAITYLIPLLLVGARVTLIGALFTGLVLAIEEYFLHSWLIKTEKTKKVADNG